MVKPGPFHRRRHAIVKALAGLVQTGDIFYRRSDARFLGLPFSTLVAKLTGSKYSHASIALVEPAEIYLVEVSELGCMKLRLIDWLSMCRGEEISLYRLIDCPPRVVQQLKIEIQALLEKDPDYDFTFSDAQAYYCTESVVALYQKAGIQLCQPKMIKEIVPTWFYWLFRPLNALCRALTGKGMPTDRPLYFVGNERHGMLSSRLTTCIYRTEA